MPPMGTKSLQRYPHPTAPPAATASSVPSGEVVYNRTLEGALRDLPYVYYQAREEVFRKHGVRTAYAFRNNQLVPMLYTQQMLTPGPARDFARFATAWELKHSKVPFGDGHGNMDPVVDANMVVVAHYGKFDSSEIFVPDDLPGGGIREEEVPVRGLYIPGQRIVQVVKREMGLKDIVQAEIPAFANKFDSSTYRSRGYRPYPTPQLSFTLVTDTDGQILFVVNSRDKDGITPSAFSPLDLISIARLATLAASATVGRLVIRTLIRRRAAKAFAEAAKREVATLAGELEAVEVREAIDGAARIPVQARRISQADIMAWEKEGGHMVRNHGPQLTKEKLKERVMGREANIPHPANRPRINGSTPDDFRVWRGDDAALASKWESEETMRRTIGDAINKNIADIRREIRAKGELVLNQRASYKTGSGWVSSVKKKAEAGMFYMDEMKGFTIVFRARKNHIPTPADPEEWYVHTAFPAPGT